MFFNYLKSSLTYINKGLNCICLNLESLINYGNIMKSKNKHNIIKYAFD